MKVLIVDDEPLAIANLEHILSDIQGISVVGTAKTGLAALHAFEARKPDLLLIDVDMPGMDGLSLAHELNCRGRPQIIFVTAFDRFASRAFDVEATDFVLKPVEPVRLGDAVERARQRLLVAPIMNAVHDAARHALPAAPDTAQTPEPDQVYWAKVGNRALRINVRSIRRIEACKDYVFIHTDQRKHMVRTTMATLERELEGTAIRRVHRSHMINLHDIQEVIAEGNSRKITLTDGTEIPVGRNFRDRLRPIGETRPPHRTDSPSTANSRPGEQHRA
ncbi:LytR/AlgR family response regulator transcription factor [Maricaulis sp.]|uniref:LytR/AlgR family response regulator transcription factor n=1 Tax=Maricaulis sp. TaxID=1486257 RepID=UPI003A94347F